MFDRRVARPSNLLRSSLVPATRARRFCFRFCFAFSRLRRSSDRQMAVAFVHLHAPNPTCRYQLKRRRSQRCIAFRLLPSPSI